MLRPIFVAQDEIDAPGIPATVRKVFVIGPDMKVKMQVRVSRPAHVPRTRQTQGPRPLCPPPQLIYPTAVGRNFAEIFRCIDALQLAAKFPIATPVNWTPGGRVMVQVRL